MSGETAMNKFQDIFDAQKALFATGITRTYEWRVDQLDRMARMIRENEERFQKAMAKDFKTASQEYIFETAASAGQSGSHLLLCSPLGHGIAPTPFAR
jgi:aldehyde dehydrogenase (NAD+)